MKLKIFIYNCKLLQIKNGDSKKDSMFSSLINKIIRKPDKVLNSNNKINNISNNSNNNNGKNTMSGNLTSVNEMGKIKSEIDLKDSFNNSKSLEVIKQKKLNRMGLGDGNVSKRLASENIDYEPVFK